MILTRKVPAALFAAFALFAAGCNSDEAEKDVKNATEDVKKAGEEAGKDVGKAVDEAGKDAEKAIPGDSDNDGK